jgi:hypothetical protein
MRGLARRAVVALVTLGVAGGAMTASAQSVGMMPGEAEAMAAWERVLEQRVDAQGRVDFKGLKESPGDLEKFVQWVGEPKDFSSAAEKKTFHLNAYNALAMHMAIRTGLEPSAKIRYFVLNRVKVDGKSMSLKSFEDDHIRSLGDPRIHAALNCMARSCPRLPKEPFREAKLDAQLDAVASEWVNAPEHVQLQADGKTVRVNEIFDFFPKDFEKGGGPVGFINRFRKEKLPADAKVEFIPYDWALNAQPGRGL